MLFNALTKTPQGVVACVFETTDSIQHMFFRYLDKGHPGAQGRPGRDERRGHRGPLRPDGRPRRPGPAEARRERASSSSCPTTASSPSGAASTSTPGSARTAISPSRTGKAESGEWFKDVDWDQDEGLRPRPRRHLPQPQGPRGPGHRRARGRGRRALKAELVRQAHRPQGRAERAASRSPRSTTATPIYSGPYKDNAPDLIIGYNEGYRASWDGVTGMVNAVVFEDNIKAWSGDHCIDPALVPGVLFSNLKLKRTGPVDHGHRPDRPGALRARAAGPHGRPRSRRRRRARRRETGESVMSDTNDRPSAAGNSSRPASPPPPRSASAARPASLPRSTAGPGPRRR